MLEEKEKSGFPAASTTSTEVHSSEELEPQIPQVSERFLLVRPTISTWRLITILICLAVGVFLALMDTAIVSTILYTISIEFGGFRMSSWVILSYTLAYVGSAVLVARLSDVFGRKNVIVTCFILFSAASLACGWCKSMNQLICFRGIQGIGGAGLYSMTMVTFPEISPPSMMPVISSIVGAIVALASVCGPTLGGVLTTEASWRWVFWLNGPCAIPPMVVLFLVWPRDFHTKNSSSPRFHQLDFLGNLCIMVGSVLLIFILNQAAMRVYEWRSAVVILLLTMSGFFWVGLFVWEWILTWHPRLGFIRPQIPFRLLTDRVMVAGFISTILTGFVLLLTIVNVPLRAQIVDLDTAITAGLHLLPLMGSSAVGSAIGGGISSKRNNTFWTLNVASALMLVGSGLLSTLPDTVTTSQKQWGFEVILGLGIGMSLSTMTFMTSMQVHFQDHAVAQGIVAQVRIFGGSIGVATSTVILNAQIEKSLTGVLNPEQLSDFYRSPIAIFSFTPLQQLLVRQAYIETFNSDMRVCTYVSAFCFVATLLVYQRNPPSMRGRLTELEAAYVESEAVMEARARA